MKLLITGGTGFIGTPLCQALARHGHELLVLTRYPTRPSLERSVRFLSWEASEWKRTFGEVEGVINLA